VLASMEQTATAFINGLPDTPAGAASPVNPLPSHA